MSQEEASFRLRGILPERRSPKSSTVSRIESGTIHDPEPYVIAGLAKIYGVELTALDPEIAREARQIGRLLLMDEADEKGSVDIRSAFTERESAGYGQLSFEDVIDLRDESHSQRRAA